MTSRQIDDRIRTVRHVGAAAAGVSAVLYLFIGLGVLSVGESSTGGTPDLFPFGVMAGGTFVAVALLLWRFESRLLWALVALLQVIVILGYVAMADVRVPPFEIWGLLVKATQVVVLGTMAVLIVMTRRPAFGGASQGRPA